MTEKIVDWDVKNQNKQMKQIAAPEFLFHSLIRAHYVLNFFKLYIRLWKQLRSRSAGFSGS